MEIYAKRIRELRLKLGYTQEHLAMLLGYSSKSSITKIESGSVGLPLQRLIPFTYALNTNIDYLLGKTDDPSAPNDSESHEYDDSENERELVKIYRHLDETHKAQLMEYAAMMYERFGTDLPTGLFVSHDA